MAAGRFSLEAIFKAKDKFTRPIAKMQTRLTKFVRKADRGFRVISSSAAKFGGALKKAGLLAGAAAAAGGLAAKHIIQTGMNFEQAITNVGAVGLKTRDQIAELEKKALDLGATTKFTATESANAMEMMAKAGFDTQDILAGVDGVLNAAAASGLGMAEVADHVSNVMKGMGLATTEATRVADVLALASSRTTSTVGSLGESMKNVSSTARQLNVPLEQAVAGVAALQDVGLDASVAGSAMNTMLTKLAAPTDSLQKKMKELGVTFEDSKGNMLPFQEVIGNLAKGADKSGGNMKQVAFLAELVGLRGQKAASNLAELFKTGKLQDLTSELKKAGGSAEKMANIRMDTLEGDLTLLGSAVNGVETKMFNLEGGALRKLTKGFTKWVTDNSDKIVAFAEKFMTFGKELAGIFGGEFMTAIQPAIDAFKSMFPPTDDAETWKSTLKVLAKSLGQVAAFVAMVSVAFVGVAGVLTVVVTAAVNIVLKFIGLLSERIGAVVFGIADFFSDLGAIFDAEGMSLGEKMLEIGKRLIEGLMDGMKALAMGPVGMIRDLGKSIVDGISETFDIGSPSRKMKEIGGFTVAGLAGGIENGVPKVRNAAADMVGAVDDAASKLNRTVAPVVNVRTRFTDLSPEDHFAKFEAEGERPSRQLITPEERMVSTMESRRETFDHRLLIEDQTGSAKLQKDKRDRSGGVSLNMRPSGSFN